MSSAAEVTVRPVLTLLMVAIACVPRSHHESPLVVSKGYTQVDQNAAHNDSMTAGILLHITVTTASSTLMSFNDKPIAADHRTAAVPRLACALDVKILDCSCHDKRQYGMNQAKYLNTSKHKGRPAN